VWCAAASRCGECTGLGHWTAEQAVTAGDRSGRPPTAGGTRAVVFDGPGALLASVFDRAQLLQGNVIVGPAVIEEAAAVTLVGPEDTVEVNAFGHLVMRLAVTP